MTIVNSGEEPTPNAPRLMPSSVAGALPPTAEPIATYEGFDALRGEVVGTLEAIAAVDQTLGLSEAAANLDSLARKVRAGVFRVLVLGEFKRGKSTLVNALLGAPLLPANVTPTTALLTVVRYGEPPAALLHTYDGATRPIPFDDLRSTLVLSTDEEANRRRQAEVQLVEVRYPAPLCRNNVELVDSPGLNEHVTRTELTSNYIRQCDAALFVLSATNFGSLTEGHFLNTHLAGKGLRHIFFAVNQLDRILAGADDPAREVRALRVLAAERLGPLCRVDGEDLSARRIHFLSARPALRARQAGDAAALQESGLPALEAALEEFLTRDRGSVMLARPLGQSAGAIEAAGEAVAFRRRALTVDLEVLEERVRRVEPRFKELQERKARILAAIRTVHAQTATAVELSLRRHVGAMADGLRDAVDGFAIDTTWSLSAMRNALVAATNDYVEAELSRWTDEMGAQVQGDLEHLVERIGDDAVGIDASLRSIRLQVLEGGEAILSPDEEASRPKEVVETILALGGQRLLGDIDVLVAGGPGWLHAAMRVVAFNLAAGVLVTALGLAAGPLVAISTTVGAAILALVAQHGAIERSVRERVAEAARPEIARIPERTLPALRAHLTTTFEELSAAIGRGIDVMIDNLRSTIDGALADCRAHEQRVEPELQRLAALDQRLAALRAEVDLLTARLGGAGQTVAGSTGGA